MSIHDLRISSSSFSIFVLVVRMLMYVFQTVNEYESKCTRVGYCGILSCALYAQCAWVLNTRCSIINIFHNDVIIVISHIFSYGHFLIFLWKATEDIENLNVMVHHKQIFRHNQTKMLFEHICTVHILWQTQTYIFKC